MPRVSGRRSRSRTGTSLAKPESRKVYGGMRDWPKFPTMANLIGLYLLRGLHSHGLDSGGMLVLAGWYFDQWCPF
jgi:hypothetical protein